ncbi:MAG: exosortase system-associated protein, TIGR04073 family [Verrucomicrobia bacterium]|nr:MAG: exosortase system-associated protein, TIGR04073 family [Verrucomicrobiota bacterium]
MRHTFSLIAATALAALFTAGCAGPEKKLGRGVTNATEFARLGDIRREKEQNRLFNSQNDGKATAFIRGFDKSMKRTLLGAYEIVTFPLPSYDPVCTAYVTPRPVYPDNFTPSAMSGPANDTDTHIGFSGGDAAPWLAGCRFRVFDSY